MNSKINASARMGCSCSKVRDDDVFRGDSMQGLVHYREKNEIANASFGDNKQSESYDVPSLNFKFLFRSASVWRT